MCMSINKQMYIIIVECIVLNLLPQENVNLCEDVLRKVEGFSSFVWLYKNNLLLKKFLVNVKVKDYF